MQDNFLFGPHAQSIGFKHEVEIIPMWLPSSKIASSTLGLVIVMGHKEYLANSFSYRASWMKIPIFYLGGKWKYGSECRIDRYDYPNDTMRWNRGVLINIKLAVYSRSPPPNKDFYIYLATELHCKTWIPKIN